MNGTCEFENGSSRVCERGTWGCVVNHDRPEEPFVQTSPGVYRESAPTKPVAPSITQLTPEEEQQLEDCLFENSDEVELREIIAKLRQPNLPEEMKTAAQESADDIIAAMLRIRLSKEDVAQLILARLTAAYEAQKGKP